MALPLVASRYPLALRAAMRAVKFRSAVMRRTAMYRRPAVQAALFGARRAGPRGASMAAKRIQRMWRNRGKRKPPANRPYPDNGPGNYEVKFVPGVAGYKGVVQKTLERYEMTIPGLGLGADNRLTNKINLRGFDVCLQMFNEKNFPVVVNMALLQFPRRETGDDPNIEDKFFRADEIGGEGTSLTFSNFASTPGWDMRYLCNRLNPDNKRILLRRKWTLGAKVLNGNTQLLRQSGYQRTFKKYIKINRKITLNGNTDVNEQPFYMVWWCLPLDSNDHNAATSSTHFRYNLRVKTVWRNVV